MDYNEIPFWACKYESTEKCPKCQIESFIHSTNKYATEKWCLTCGYFSYSWINCCNNQDPIKVIYYMKDGRASIREQCMNCGKLLFKNAISFKNINQEELPYFNESKKLCRDNEILLLKKDFEKKINFNFTLRYHKGYIDYLKSEKWKSLRLKILQRDNYKCQKCKSEKAIHVHHLTYKNLGHEDLEDLISICINCHTIEHFNN